jgi:Fe-Mn family superoxide dismutase
VFIPEENTMATQTAPFQLPPLPWPENALDPVISANTLSFHYGKHHRAYVNKLNELAQGTRFADMTLEQIVKESAGKEQKVFNNAAQAWNHTFFWNCLRKEGGKPSGALASRIDADCGGYDAFKKKFAEAAVNCFGSGWAWLVWRNNKLAIESTSNQDSPLMTGATPLLGIDVWEHAYYLKYQNRRPEYVKAFQNVVNWDFVSERFSKAGQA